MVGQGIIRPYLVANSNNKAAGHFNNSGQSARQQANTH